MPTLSAPGTLCVLTLAVLWFSVNFCVRRLDVCRNCINFVVMEIISASSSEYSDILIAVKEIRKAIVDSRYQLAKLVNKKAITLYYNIGEYIYITILVNIYRVVPVKVIGGQAL